MTQLGGTAAPNVPTSQEDRVNAALEGTGHKWIIPRDGMSCVEVERDDAHALLERLRHAGFETCTLVTAIDHYPQEPRFAVVWQLLSVQHNDRIRIETRITENDASVRSCIDLWPGAAFSERECFDMFGIRFDGHAGLKRLLMPEGYDHFPLRKDFPHQGIQPDRLYREWDSARRSDWSEDR
jgi:NADH-quinone oxidoreductase subunit C